MQKVYSLDFFLQKETFVDASILKYCLQKYLHQDVGMKKVIVFRTRDLGKNETPP